MLCGCNIAVLVGQLELCVVAYWFVRARTVSYQQLNTVFRGELLR
jgi:hypothetical protein